MACIASSSRRRGRADALGVIDNSQKSIDPAELWPPFAWDKKETYEFLNGNEDVEFRTIDYTNNPLVIARQRNMAAINSALEIDLTGQATAESLDHAFYSGIGGQADFMRGAVLAPGGKTILALALHLLETEGSPGLFLRSALGRE